MPASKSMRLRAMYAGYESGRSLEDVAADFGFEVGEMVQEFQQRGYLLLPPDQERFASLEAPAGKAKTPGKRGRKSLHSEAEVQAMYDRYEAGKTLAEVAAEFHVSPATIGNVFRRAGFDIRPRGTRNWPEDLARAMYQRYEAGEALSVIGDSHGLTGTQVRQCFRQHGFELRTAPPKPQLAEDESKVRALWELFDGGMELEDVAAKANLTLGQLRAMFQLHHLPLRRLTFSEPPRRKVAAASLREEAEARVASQPRSMSSRESADSPAAAGVRRVPRLGDPLPSSAPEAPVEAGPLLEAPDDPVEREQLAMQMYSLYEAGKSFSDIAVIFRTSAGLVQQLFGEFHLALKTEQQPRRPRDSRFKGPGRDWG